VKFSVIVPFSGMFGNLVGERSPSIYSMLANQLGLKFTCRKAAVEEWVIDRAEKPAGNRAPWG
jgi:uncharacterized protein (TIGR03435 family)